MVRFWLKVQSKLKTMELMELMELMDLNGNMFYSDGMGCGS
jgi:hypothetical protein